MEAVADCIDRDAEFVREYLAANFEMDPQAELPPSDEKPETGTEEPHGDEPESEDEAGGETGQTETEGEEEQETGEPEDDYEPTPPEEEEGQTQPPKPEKPPKPREPSFMDRYAKSRGFRWHEAERCYTHANGAWIEKGESPFSWHEHADGTGVTKRLFVAEETLTRGVELSYELWRLMELNPDSISLVLAADDGCPCEWSATELHELKITGQIFLHQSRFILKQQSN
jgi:hypothetical protein